MKRVWLLVLALPLAGCDRAYLAQQSFPDRVIYSFPSRNLQERLGYACVKGADEKARAAQANALFERAVERFARAQAARITERIEQQGASDRDAVGALVQEIRASGESWANTTAGEIEAKTQCVPLSAL